MAVTQSITKKFIPKNKDISYLSKNFGEFRQNLVEFAKAYYPNTYTDFNEASPGMMFIEMAAYVGDVLSYYIDTQYRENLLLFAQEPSNVISISQALGYKPRLTAAATVNATIFQIVPALGISNNYEPDERFLLKVLMNSKFSTNTPPIKTFRSVEDIDFADPLGRSNYRILTREIGTGVPTSYVVSKTIKLMSADIKTATFSFGSPQKFSRVQLSDPDVINIVSVIDSDGNPWYEVDYLGQDIVMEDRTIDPRTSLGYLQSGSMQLDSIPPAKILQLKNKPRRFVTRINSDMKMELWFGSGGVDSVDESILTLNSTDIANTKYNQRVANTSLDPSDFLKSDTFGIAPANVTLTVTYAVGGGIQSNVASNTITTVDQLNVGNDINNYASTEQNLYVQTVNSVTIINEEPATGGAGMETVEELRQNALAFFNAQNRVVTDKDYLVRTLALPSKYGSVAKAFVVRDEQINSILSQNSASLAVNNDQDPYNNRSYITDPLAPNAINLYVLGYNSQKKLTTLNSLVKQNLKSYLEQYRVLTDEVFILDAFVVNIGVRFDIIVFRNYNMNDVLARSIDAVKTFFDIDRWQINQPIILNDLRMAIGAVDGVQTVTNVEIFNKYGFKDNSGERIYQGYRYPIDEATSGDIIFPSLDPCIFELRYPDTDIIGNARQ